MIEISDRDCAKEYAFRESGVALRLFNWKGNLETLRKVDVRHL
jgi:hypothetical protein